MSELAMKLKVQLATLPATERADLAYFLLQSLGPENGAADTDEDDEAEFDAELERRWEEIVSGKAVGRPMEEVLADLRKKYP